MTRPSHHEAKRPTQIGFVVLQADETLEPDMRRLLPGRIEYLVTRVPSGDEVSTDSLQAMEAQLTEAAARLPRGANFAALGYGCTSATAQIGADRVAELIGAGAATPAVTDPLTALVAACRHLKLRRIGLVSPYVESVSDRLREVLKESGITVTQFESFDEPNEARVVRIDRTSVLDAALSVGEHPNVDAVFLSCTNLQTLECIDEAEAMLGKTVMSSNQVLAWHLAELADFKGELAHIGHLSRA